MSFSKHELEHYSRQLGMPGWGEEGQERLGASQVFIAGAGGLGCAASVYLVAAGVGKIVVCDSDLVELSNLNRQTLYSLENVGWEKAPIAVEKLRTLNPRIHVEAVTTEIDYVTAQGLIRGSSLVLDCLDNPETRFALNRAAIAERIPMIYAAVSEFTGYLSFLNPPSTPCLECFVSRTPPPVAPPIPGCTAGVVGTLEAMEALKFLVGIGELLAGRLLVIEGEEPRFDVIEVERNPACESCRGLH